MMDIVTWNIQKGLGVDFRRDISRTARILAALDADIVGLQEVLRLEDNDQAAALASALGMNLSWGSARTARGGTFGNALLVRGEIHSEIVHDFSVPHCERRVCLEALVAVRGAMVRVFVCHFGLGLRERARQADRLLQVLQTAPRDTPRIVLGDFNEWQRRGPVHRALQTEFPHAPAPARTHPSPWPLFALDRMAWDASLRGTIRVGDVARASDHRLLHAKVEAA